jgi:hypothetical protein
MLAHRSSPPIEGTLRLKPMMVDWHADPESPGIPWWADPLLWFREAHAHEGPRFANGCCAAMPYLEPRRMFHGGPCSSWP